MNLQNTKHALSAAWAVAVVAVATKVDLTMSVSLALLAFGAIPPLALLLLWNEPAPTLSESISAARR